MRILSPAKINLMLRILGQRDDGYHYLQTYFQLLDWGDNMEFTLVDEDQITISGEFNQLPIEDNLIFKAVQLLVPYRKIHTGVVIKVDKHIPQGSGLGGGSSNAGTTLRVLNKLWDCQLSQVQLLKLAIKLGADVPIFIINQSAMATGIGEELILHEIKSQYFVLIFPKTSISTKEVFQYKHLKKNQSHIKVADIANQKNWTNTFLPVVLDHYPEVKDIYTAASQFVPIYMSGTGSTLFSCFKNKADSCQFIEQCPSHWNTTICMSKIIE